MLQSNEPAAEKLRSSIAQMTEEVDAVQQRVVSLESQARALHEHGRGVEGASMLLKCKTETMHYEALTHDLSDAKQRLAEVEEAQQVCVCACVQCSPLL